MKLRTELKNTRHNGIMAFGVGVEDTQHDLLAAHALLQAMESFRSGEPYIDDEWLDALKERADELMREWTTSEPSSNQP